MSKISYHKENLTLVNCLHELIPSNNIINLVYFYQQKSVYFNLFLYEKKNHSSDWIAIVYPVIWYCQNLHNIAFIGLEVLTQLQLFAVGST